MMDEVFISICSCSSDAARAGFANWSDPEFERMLSTATSIPSPAERMKQLVECEARLMRAMPLIPLYFDSWVYLERPEVHGLSPGPLGCPAFEYAWIDTNRSASWASAVEIYARPLMPYTRALIAAIPSAHGRSGPALTGELPSPAN